MLVIHGCKGKTTRLPQGTQKETGMARIRAVFFDAVGTLIHPAPPPAAVYSEIGRRFGSNLHVEAIRQTFRVAVARQNDMDCVNGWRTSEPREVDRWRAVVREVLNDVKDQEACFEELFEHFAKPAHWRCEPHLPELLVALDMHGCKVGMASNYDNRLRRVAAGIAPLAAIKSVIISSEVGWRKPARQFFSALCSSVDLPPDAVLHVGDDPENDYQGALSAGCQAALLTPGTSPSATRSIRNLSQVLHLLG
jgi:putative hydrolase of the HAD superfamily